MSSSLKKRFFLSGLMLTLVALAMRTVTMLFGAFISRTVGAEGTGVYTLIMTVYSFAVTFATSGISLTVTRLVAASDREHGGAHRVIRGACLYSLIFGSVATAALFFGAELIGGVILADPRTVLSFKILAASLIPVSLISVFSGYFVGVKRVSFNAAVQVFGQGVRILITVILLFNMSKYGVVGSVTALSVATTLTELLSFLLILAEFLVDRRRNLRKNKEGSELRRVATAAIPLALSAYVRSAFLTVEHIMIPEKLRERGESDSDAYAHYGTLHGMALPVITYPMTPLTSFSGLLVPEFASDLADGREMRMSRITTSAMSTTLTYATAVAVFIYAFSEELGYVLYSSQSSGYYVALLAPIIPIMYLDHVTDAMLKGIGEQVYAMWVNITDSVLSVVLVAILIPKMGIAGYTVVIVVMEAYNFLLSFLKLRSRIRFDLHLVRSVLIPLAASAVSVSLTAALFSAYGSLATASHLLIKMLFAASLTVALIALCGSLSAIVGKNRQKTAYIK